MIWQTFPFIEIKWKIQNNICMGTSHFILIYTCKKAHLQMSHRIIPTLAPLHQSLPQSITVHSDSKNHCFLPSWLHSRVWWHAATLYIAHITPYNRLISLREAWTKRTKILLHMSYFESCPIIKTKFLVYIHVWRGCAPSISGEGCRVPYAPLIPRSLLALAWMGYLTVVRFSLTIKGHFR